MAGPQLVCVYQFKVLLRGITPTIWRRRQLRSDQSVADLHYAIQIAMGSGSGHNAAILYANVLHAMLV